VIGNIIATSLNEAAYTFTIWKNTTVETEELKKANLQSRLESLKNQVNPHFLFNALNSLSSLINESPDEAEKFLDEMTKVYRYLLRNNEQELTTLSTEVKFLQSYFHLLKTRYGEGIVLNLSILPDYENYMIPPLTLQLLVENAVKHNVILREKPLHINVETIPGGQLMVRNSLQLKTVHVASNKVGLRNIAAKYKLMNQPEIIIAQDETYFSVTLPLMKSTENLKPARHETI
jgi:LytS/YehU family sensor histidine kinase